MGRHRILDDIEFSGNFAGSQSDRASFNQQTKGFQAGFLGQGRPADVFFICALLAGIWLALQGFGRFRAIGD